MSEDISVARARIEEIQPLAAEYKQTTTAEGRVEPALPSGALFWLARDEDGQSAGYAAGTLRPEGLVLGPVYVRGDYRRRGVGLKLLHEIERWAGRARIPVVEVSVAADNDAGRGFLEAGGSRVRRLLMAREGEAE